MSDDETHVSNDEWIDYFSRALTDEEEAALEFHVVSCSDCAELAQLAFVESSHWDEWGVVSHVAATEDEPAATASRGPLVRTA